MNSDADVNRGATSACNGAARRRRRQMAIPFVPFKRVFLSGAFVTCVILAGCSGKIITEEDDSEDSSGGSGGSPPAGGTAGTGGEWTVPGGNQSTGGEPYVDPECPDEEPPEPSVECDPLDPFKDCPEGYGCYPYLEYPFGEGCGHAMFGSVCIPAGEGEQGDFCDDSYCAPGYMCVVGATGGKRCGQICEPIRDYMCEPGLICGETDIQGYGVCF
jgi:hypothetical protein